MKCSSGFSLNHQGSLYSLVMLIKSRSFFGSDSSEFPSGFAIYESHNHKADNSLGLT